MNRLAHNIIGWGAGLAIGMTIGVSLNNIILGVGVGVAIGAGLATTQANFIGKNESFKRGKSFKRKRIALQP